MRNWIAIPLMALLPVLFTGCDDDNDVLEPEPFAEFAGDFEAETFTFVSADDPALSTDLVERGATFDVTIEPDGDVFTTLTRASGEVVTTQAVLENQGDLLFLRETTGQMREFAVTPRGNDLLRLTNDEAFFDFNLDGELDAAEFEADLVPA